MGLERIVSKPIERFPGYEVDNIGRVYSHKSKKYLKTYIGMNGYINVALYHEGKARTIKVHRLVIKAFIPVPIGNNRLETNHKDGIKTNNTVDNLEWITSSQNTKHAIGLDLMAGATAPKPVLQFTKYGRFIREFPSAHEVFRQIGINTSNINAVINGYKYRKTAGGYVWKYKEAV